MSGKGRLPSLARHCDKTPAQGGKSGGGKKKNTRITWPLIFGDGRPQRSNFYGGVGNANNWPNLYILDPQGRIIRYRDGADGASFEQAVEAKKSAAAGGVK